MEVGEAIVALGAGERPASFDQFSAAIDPQWIADALAATDTASVRRRQLPAEHVVWLVIGMGLFRDRSIAQVVHHLDLVVPAPTGARRRVTYAAIVQARDQLGAAPLAALFTQTAQEWARSAADADRWRGLAVYGLDGTTLRVADTPENVAHFGRPPSRHGEGAGYPQLRLVTLLALRAHVLAAAAFGPYRTSEVALATQVWAALPEHAVVILERWELELAFDELKTHTCERVEALRSKAPARVQQEVWGLLLAYNLVRLVMCRAAPRAGAPPIRLSFRYALLAVRAFWHAAWDTSPGILPRRLDALLDELALFVLPERRPRRYPRAVKIKMSNYPRNRPHRRRSRAK